MTRAQWILIAILTPPLLILATLVSAFLGPLGALTYAALLTAGINTRHLFTDRNRNDR